MSLDVVISTALLASGGTGLLILIALFLRKVISSTSKEAAVHSAEVDILNMWKLERDTLKVLTEELQKERVELMMKLSSLQSQMNQVRAQLEILIQDKRELVKELDDCRNRCATCPHKP